MGFDADPARRRAQLKDLFLIWDSVIASLAFFIFAAPIAPPAPIPVMSTVGGGRNGIDAESPLSISMSEHSLASIRTRRALSSSAEVMLPIEVEDRADEDRLKRSLEEVVPAVLEVDTVLATLSVEGPRDKTALRSEPLEVRLALGRLRLRVEDDVETLSGMTREETRGGATIAEVEESTTPE